VLNSYPSVKTKAQTIVITRKKDVLQKGPEVEKKVWLNVGLNPQLRWLTTVCILGFDRNVQQLFTVFLVRCNERTKAAIN